MTIAKLPNGAILKGGMDWLVEPDLNTGLMIRCNGVRQQVISPVVVLPRGYEALQDTILQVPEIQIDWTDYSTPQLKENFWLELYKMLPSKNIIAYCQGGHGRTGTAIACLMVASGAYSAPEAINHVRTVYCDKAIESKGQEFYIAQVEAIRDSKPVQEIVTKLEAEIAERIIELDVDTGINDMTKPENDEGNYEALRDKCALCNDPWTDHDWNVCVGAYDDSENLNVESYDMSSGQRDLHPSGGKKWDFNSQTYKDVTQTAGQDCDICGAEYGAMHSGHCENASIYQAEKRLPFDEFDPDRPSINDRVMQAHTKSMANDVPEYMQSETDFDKKVPLVEQITDALHATDDDAQGRADDDGMMLPGGMS